MARAVEKVLNPSSIHACSNSLVRDDAVPELVTGLVDRDALRRRHAGGREPARAGGEQRRVFHAARAALPRRVDDRDVAVRVRAEPLP